MHPAEEHGVVCKTQTISFLQNESHSLHWANTQVLFPGLDVERGAKMTWPVRLSEAGRSEAYDIALSSEVVGIA
jgi:hypothetical protein